MYTYYSNIIIEIKKYILNKDLVRIMANSRDFEELLYTWRSWRENIGYKIRPKYIKYTELVNEAAIAIGTVVFY